MTEKRKHDCINRYVFELTKDKDYAKRVADNAEFEGFDNYETLIKDGRKLFKKDIEKFTEHTSIKIWICKSCWKYSDNVCKILAPCNFTPYRCPFIKGRKSDWKKV